MQIDKHIITLCSLLRSRTLDSVRAGWSVLGWPAVSAVDPLGYEDPDLISHLISPAMHVARAAVQHRGPCVHSAAVHTRLGAQYAVH